MMHGSFHSAIHNIKIGLKKRAVRVRTESWQGIPARPDMDTYELKHVFIQCEMPQKDLLYYQQQIEPNLPWADDHFEQERVSGEPINPGKTWRQWPYAHSAEKFRTVCNWTTHEPQFNHSYAERYWPKLAGQTPDGRIGPNRHMLYDDHSHKGIRYRFGDLADVVDQLAREPHTRQAILPVFFPEDTGAVHGGRVPCSLFYQFLVRPDNKSGQDKIDITYTIRSCDWTRHFRDDVYLTVRLLLWVLGELRKKDERWNEVVPGTFVMLITSLHVFVNDYIAEFG